MVRQGGQAGPGGTEQGDGGTEKGEGVLGAVGEQRAGWSSGRAGEHIDLAGRGQNRGRDKVWGGPTRGGDRVEGEWWSRGAGGG